MLFPIPYTNTIPLPIPVIPHRVRHILPDYE